MSILNCITNCINEASIFEIIILLIILGVLMKAMWEMTVREFKEGMEKFK